MAKPRLPKPVVLVAGITARDRETLKGAKVELSLLFGPIALESPIFPFKFTRYYEAEMGPELIKQFVAFRRPVRPEDLASIKLTTNALELSKATKEGGKLRRRVNVDPGYVAPSRLVLATTKDYSHRIYIGNGIYAEVTLIFRRGTWTPLDWTYPDYRTELALDFFLRVRGLLTRFCKSSVSSR
ncbi:MAG TPA: DUF4416 family protein [Candidatus Latescibacteria bacterium]|nr:DUF4416 family protein [Candidatus Latescibacterota bacterium]